MRILLLVIAFLTSCVGTLHEDTPINEYPNPDSSLYPGGYLPNEHPTTTTEVSI